MNQDQFMGIVRAIVPPLAAYVAGKGWIPAGSTADVMAAAIALATAGWSTWVHTDSSKLAAVEALPDVQKIVPMKFAAPDSAVAQAALDPDRPKVQDVVTPGPGETKRP